MPDQSQTGETGISRGGDPGLSTSDSEGTQGRIDANRRAVGDVFAASIESWVDPMLDRFREEIDPFSQLTQPEIWDATRQVTMITRRSQAYFVGAGRMPPDFAHDAEVAALGARRGMSLESVLRSYQLSASWAWEAWMRALHGADVAPEDLDETLSAIAALVREYEERMIAAVADGYHLAQAELSPTTSRLKSVRAFLDGYSDTLTGSNYPLQATHIGVILWGASGPTGLRQAAGSVGADTTIVNPFEGGPATLLWAWLAVPEGRQGAVLDALGKLEVAGASRMAIGDPHPGPEGFRRTHREAGVAYAIATRTDRAITTHRSVALEGLALADEDAARRFVEAELGDLDCPGRKETQLRATLAAYLETGHNASSAASRLGVHEGTVSRRLAAIASAVGATPVNRSAELQLALRLRPLLARPDEDPS